MGTTDMYGLRFPDPSEGPDGPLAFQNLAEDIEGTFGSPAGSTVYDTGWNALVLAIGTGTCQWRREGNRVWVQGSVTATIGVGQTYVVATGGLPAAVCPPTMNVPGTAALNGFYDGGAVVRTDGGIYIYQQTGASRGGAAFQVFYLLG